MAQAFCSYVIRLHYFFIGGGLLFIGRLARGFTASEETAVRSFLDDLRRQRFRPKQPVGSSLDSIGRARGVEPMFARQNFSGQMPALPCKRRASGKRPGLRYSESGSVHSVFVD